MVKGRLYLTENPPHLNELIPIGDKYFVVYPPMPAILMIPLAAILDNNQFQTRVSIILGALNGVLVYLLFLKMGFSQKISILITILFAFGTNHWYLASVGSAWFIAHIVAIFFMLLALLETFGKQRLFLIGFLIGCAFWARSTTIFTLPFFYIILGKQLWPISKKNVLKFVLLNMGIGIWILIDIWYNFVRFGSLNPLIPYHLIPNIDRDLVFKDGFMSIKFIPRHIEAAFLKLPIFSDRFPYILPSLYSLAIWFTTPAIFYIFKAKKSLLVLASWAAISTTFFVIMLWAGVGYSQYGYRFVQDFIPFILILISIGIGSKPNIMAYLLIILSIIVNLWGIVMINKLNTWVI
ncbi:hypothetical protein HYS94_02925 [Candidatus Daviesbacteria bacterium]|nr:hypothetical protein [Candidatus Daviesbacteria bacterium]